MKSKLIAAGLFAAAALAGTASACIIPIAAVCPNNNLGVPNIHVCATKSTGDTFCGDTDANGNLQLDVPSQDTYTVCVTVPHGDTLISVNGGSASCISYFASQDITQNPPIEVIVDSPACSATPGPCWETGGGTLDKVKGDNVWSFGGVIYPGCSSAAAGGGNLNIVNHVTGLHFKGTDFIVDDCRGVSTRSPKVTVNIIDWHGTGYVTGADGSGRTLVTFVGTFMDAHDGGAGRDGLYISVTDLSGNPVFQIGDGPDALDLLTTGNVQIHQSSCGKGKP